MRGSAWRASVTDVADDRVIELDEGRASLRERVTARLHHIHTTYPGALAYIVPAVLASLAAQTWFTSGTVIANGDIGPPVVHGTSYLSHWNQVADGVGAPSYDIVALPYAGFLRAAQALGLGPPGSQRIWLTLLIAGSSAAVVFFARSLSLSPLAAAMAGIFATFNVYRIILATYDPVPVTALILCGLLGGLVVRAGLRNDPRSGLLVFVAISAASGFVFTNPPHFVLLAAWVAICTLLAWARGGSRSFRSALAFLLRASPLVVLVNAWWIVPAVLTIQHPIFSERLAAPGPFAWAWTDRRASLSNAFTLNTTWGWNEPMYYPYAARMEQLPFALLRFALPLLALLGLALSRGRVRRLALSLVAVGLVTVLVVKGLHPPLVEVNRWFYVHVPGSWLFREPSKVLLYLVLAYAVLAGIGVARLAAMNGHSRIPAMVGVALLSIAAVVYAYPLFTGAVIPDRRPVLPSAHVQMPSAWSDASAYLNALPDEGKLLVLPNADFYGLPTTWGYYGVPFTRLAIQRPVLEPLPGGGFNLPGNAEALTTSVQGDLLTGRGTDAVSALRALGVRYILLRRDLDTSFQDRRLADPNTLARGLSTVPGIQLVRSFGLLDVYALEPSEGSEVYSAVPALTGGQPGLMPAVLPMLPQDQALIPAEGVPHTTSADGAWSPGGRTRILRIGTEALWRVEAAETSTGLSVRFVDPTISTLGQQTVNGLPPRSLDFRHVEAPALISVGSDTFLIRGGHGPVRLGYATLPRRVAVRAWERRGLQPIDVTAYKGVDDCNNYDHRSPQEVGLSASTVRRDGIPTLQLSAPAHTACVSYPIKPFDPAARYRVQFDYRGVSGSTPRACLWQDGAERCAALPELDPSRGWHHFDATTELSSKTQALRLYFYAEGTGDGITTTEYRRAALESFGQDVTRRVALHPTSDVGRHDLPEGWLPTSTGSPLPDPLPIDVTSHDGVGDCNRFDDRSPEALGLSATTGEPDGIPTLQLSARDHTACVSFPVKPFDPAARYRVQFDYLGVSGSAPRVCLWQAVAERCAQLPELDPSPGWHHFDATAALSPKTQALRLYFYAEGTGVGTTTTEYRDVVVTVDPESSLFLVQDVRSTQLPVVGYEKPSPDEFDVHVSGADAPYLLVLTESYAEGWRVQVDGEDVNVPHVTVDGYANGWLLDQRGTYDVRLVYGPERFARVARWASLIFLCALAAYGLARWFRYGGRTRQVERLASTQLEA